MSSSDNYKLIRQFRGKEPLEVVKETGISKQNVNAWEHGTGNPGKKFIDQLSRFFDVPKEIFYKEGLTIDYLKNNFSVKNNTQVNNSTGSKEKEQRTARETFYADLIENNDEYTLMPRAVIRDYKIVPDKLIDIITESNAQLNKETQKKNELIIEGLEHKIVSLKRDLEKLERENEDLRRQIPAKD